MKAIDPVCKMEVESSTTLHRSYKGLTYYFCSKGCMKDFSKNPEKYLKESPGHSR